MPASIVDAPLEGQVHWDFGDGTHADTGYLSVGQDLGQTGQGEHGAPRFTHAFAPGTYKLTASGRDTAGNAVAWTVRVRVYPRLLVAARCRAAGGHSRLGGRRALLSASAAGGRGQVLRWQWRFGGGGRAEGARVRHRFPPTRHPGHASVTAFDASGAQASARVGCPRANARRARHRARRPRHTGARFTG
jgi:hypothetical protein